MTKVTFILLLVLCNSFSADSVITNETVRTIFEIITPYLRINRLQVFRGPKCFPDLGCFNNSGFKHPLYRPISLSPEEPEKIGTKFFLYSEPDQINPQLINKENLTKSAFNPKLRTVFAVHGFYFGNYLGQYQIESFSRLRKALLTKENVNYIFVDWGKGASTWYVQATANTQVVGAQIAQLMRKILVTFNVSKDKFWLIGHSLGAHVVAYAGSIVKNIGRITGLDPAKPYFVGMPVDIRLDGGDATFVDVIHTNSPQINQPFGFGLSEGIGHIDYYPNGGNNQPGCLKEEVDAFSKSLQYGIQKVAICNHERSISMLTEAIENRNCEMISYGCDSFSSFKIGNCYLCGPNGQNCKIMGKLGPDDQQSSRYFLLTNSEPPFCVNHYRISITTGDISSTMDNMFLIHANLISNKVVAAGHSGKIKLDAYSKYAFLLTGDRLSKDRQLRLELWVESEFADGSINLSHVEITPMYYLDDKMKMSKRKQLDNLKIDLNQKVKFKF